MMAVGQRVAVRVPINTGGGVGCVAVTLRPRLGRSQAARILSESRAGDTRAAPEAVRRSFVDPKVHFVDAVAIRRRLGGCCCFSRSRQWQRRR